MLAQSPLGLRTHWQLLGGMVSSHCSHINKKKLKKKTPSSGRHLAQGARPSEHRVGQMKMLAPGGHQGHRRPPFSFLISIVQLLPHETVTPTLGDLTSTGHPEGEGREGAEDKSEKLFHPDWSCHRLTRHGRRWRLLFRGPLEDSKGHWTACSSPLPPHHLIFPNSWFPNIEGYEKGREGKIICCSWPKPKRGILPYAISSSQKSGQAPLWCPPKDTSLCAH